MARQIQLRQGATAEHNTFTGALGEITYDTDKKVVVTHDGVAVGGHPNAARANADGTISLIKKDGSISGNISATGLFNNTLTSTATDQALTAAQGKALSDSKLDKTSIAATGTAPYYVCRAWVNFNGYGVVAIRGEGNVSSITDLGVGVYKVNFTTPMLDTNYCTVGSSSRVSSPTSGADEVFSPYLQETTGVSFHLSDNSTGLHDAGNINVAIFR